jgi:hypothetical protein
VLCYQDNNDHFHSFPQHRFVVCRVFQPKNHRANVVELGEKSLRILADGKYSLCFASAVGSATSNENYDVVALSVPSNGVPFFFLTAPTEFVHRGSALAPTNRITWSTKYDMAATTQQFQAGSGIFYYTESSLSLMDKF